MKYDIDEGKDLVFVSRDVLVPQELKHCLKKWKVNLSAIAREMSMNPQTFHNKIKGNLGTGFTPEEFSLLSKVLKGMAEDLFRASNMYPQG